MKISSSSNSQILNLISDKKTNADTTLEKIAATKELSGKDSASLIISDALSSQISSLTQNVQNANETVSMYQIADSSLQAISAGTEQLNDLAVRSNNASLSSDQKAMLQEEFDAISSSMQDIANQTTYNGQNLLSSNYGLDVSGLSSLSLDNQEGIANFRENLSSLSQTAGNQINASSSSITNSLTTITNLSSANSQISETPLDQKITQIKSDEIKLTSAVLAQVHQNSMMQQSISALLS
ncbi:MULTISPECIES: flagellin [unclassified Sulfurospirillum]|uniref:flagellin n=1 Tax=unclassified Sulfurospirillum TaxID=2618290 RepID=UPI000507583B|nr:MULTISPECIES: flagellin [unclassified Sulfurospirillum]KFL34207.1 flagellin [Sulfurospirillum sp. SCADC]